MRRLANEKKFEIQKRQNHYEIIARTDEPSNEENETINFLDVAQGLNYWKQCKSGGRSIFVGYAKIKVVISNESDQLLERFEKFLLELFGVEGIFVEEKREAYIGGFYSMGQPRNRDFIFTVMAGEIPTIEDSENLLNDCITLNSYSTYFLNKTGFESIQIVCGMKCYKSYLEMSLNCKGDIIEKQVQFKEQFAIDELVRINTSAKKELKDISVRDGLYPYNFVFKQLKENLMKYI